MSDEADAVEIIHYLIEDLGVLEDAWARFIHFNGVCFCPLLLSDKFNFASNRQGVEYWSQTRPGADSCCRDLRWCDIDLGSLTTTHIFKSFLQGFDLFKFLAITSGSLRPWGIIRLK
jgi:hypothetical protein